MFRSANSEMLQGGVRILRHSNSSGMVLFNDPLWKEWRNLIICLMLMCLAGGSHALAAQIGAVVSPNPVAAGESTVYQLQIANAKADQLPEFPDIDGLEVSYAGQSSNSRTVFSGGRMQAFNTLIYQWRIVPQKEGVYLIPPLEVVVDGSKQQTSSVQLRVSKAVDYSQYAFIQMNLPKKQFYEGEPFAFSIDLYELNANVQQAPDLVSDGFVVERISDNLRQTRQVINGRTYNVWSLDYIARPVRNGELQLGPVSWPASLVFRQQSRSRGIFDSFFDDFNAKRRDVTLTAEGESLKILSLPAENRPDSFNGAIGNYTMEVNATPTELTTGDPLTITIRISGTGPLDAVPMPPIDHWEGFKTYPPNATTEAVDKTGLKGVRIFEQVIIPQSSDIKELPALEFSYFDTTKSVYETLTEPAIPLMIKANPNAPSMPTQSLEITGESGLPKPKAKDVVPIKPFLGNVVISQTPWLMNPGFYWLHLTPLALLGVAWGIRQLSDKSSKDVHGRRKRKADQFIKSKLPELDRLAQSNDSDAFFELMFRLIQERLGQCLDQPASSITESVLEQADKIQGLTEEDVEQLHALFQACNQARYAPVRSSEALAVFAGKCRSLVTRIG
ncbi:MAG: BatD family protein [Verrucomicrobia bacterium]|nr:BatD family protein [Verrucomicrobiota bacterium]